MNDNTVAITGRVGTAPRLRTAKNGQAVSEFRLARTPRYQDRESGDWVDGRTMWVTVVCWRSLARNVAKSVGVGALVMVHGKLAYDQWDGSDGGRRSEVKIVADAVGFDLSAGIAEFHKIRWSGPAAAEHDESASEQPAEGAAAEASDGPDAGRRSVWVGGEDPGEPDLPDYLADDEDLPASRAEPVPAAAPVPI